MTDYLRSRLPGLNLVKLALYNSRIEPLLKFAGSIKRLPIEREISGSLAISGFVISYVYPHPFLGISLISEISS